MTLKLKHCAADWCFLAASTLEPAAYYRRLRDLGYSGVEMVSQENLPLARAAGLTLVTQGAHGIDRGLNRPAHHPELIAAIRAGLRQARAERIEQLIVFSGRRDSLDDRSGIDACASALRQVAREAEDAGVVILLELLNESDHPDYQCSHLSYASAVVAAVASPAVRILYDIYHATRMGEDCARFDPALMPLVGHVHLAACAGRSCPRPGATPSYPPIVAHFNACGYRGWWGQEFIPGADPFAELGAARAYIESGDLVKQAASA